MKILLIADCVVALVMLILATELAQIIKVKFRKDYPNAVLNSVPMTAKIIGQIATIVKALIPIYNLICVVGFLFARDKIIDDGYEMLIDRIIQE